MFAKQLVIIFSLFIVLSLSDEEVKPPRNFTRSRYSHRKTPVKTVLITNDTLVEIPASNSTEELLATNDDNVTIAIQNQTNEITNQRNKCGEKIGENHPWIAVLEHSDPTGRNRKKTLSKGVLIDTRHILTTVSSIHNSRPFWIVSKIRLGDTPTWGAANVKRNRSSVVHIDVAEIFNHKHRDIAIIKLAREVNITDYISPICLPEDDNYDFKELDLHICKRASAMSITRAPLVSSVRVAPLTPQDCSIMFQRKRAQFSNDEFCAWDETGDTCTGDLGGPLTGTLNGRHQVIGLNSYINSKSDFKADEYPGIYTKVGAHLKWIKKVLEL